MSDNENRDLFEQERSPQSELLDELDSLKELLHEEPAAGAPFPASVDEIHSVKQYMQLKQEAEAAGLTLDTYLTERARAHAEEAEGAMDEEIEIPTLDEVVAFDDIGEIDDGVDIPVLEETVEIPPLEEAVAIPTAEEVVEAAHLIGGGFSLEEIEHMVKHIVQEKLQEIRPQLEKQVFDEIRNMLPVDRFK